MPNPSESSPIAWWESLKHGGMLIAPARVAAAFADAADPLSSWNADRLRREIVRAENQKSDLSDLLDVVLEQVCGFTVGWFKGTRVGSEWSTRTPAGENIKPRRVWQHEGGTLPVFVDEEPRLGIGRGRRSVARVIEWLRARSLNLALLTNGRQWRLIYAGIDHDAFSEWDTQLWFAEGEPGLQVDALRRLIAPQRGKRRHQLTAKPNTARCSKRSSTAARARTNFPPCSASASAKPWNCSSAHTVPPSIGSQHRQMAACPAPHPWTAAISTPPPSAPSCGWSC